MFGEEFFHHLPMIKNIIMFARDKKNPPKVEDVFSFRSLVHHGYNGHGRRKGHHLHPRNLT